MQQLLTKNTLRNTQGEIRQVAPEGLHPCTYLPRAVTSAQLSLHAGNTDGPLCIWETFATRRGLSSGSPCHGTPLALNASGERSEVSLADCDPKLSVYIQNSHFFKEISPAPLVTANRPVVSNR